MKEALKNPTDFICTSCKAPFPNRTSITGNGDGKLHKGLIMVCAECAAISVLGDSILHPMSKEEFVALPETTKRALVITKTQIENLLKSGGKWNPHTVN